VSLDRSPIGWRLRDLLVAAGVGRRVELTASSTLASPVALPGGEICLPRRALLELESGQQDSMLAHEVAHIVRRDPQWLIAARAIEAVLFFQPLNRLARRRMQEVAEYLCDDWAVARTSRPVMLAKCLAAVAEWVGRAPSMETPRLRALSAMVESHGSPLVRRVGRILGRRRAPDRRTSRIAFASATLGLGVIAAALPRVSIATPAGSPLAFVRERGDTREMVVERGLVLLRRIGTARTLIDSITRPSGGAMAGPRLPGGDVIVQRILIDTTTLVDTSGSDRHLRPILPPAYDPANHIRQRR
jgi:hypothetical protein